MKSTTPQTQSELPTDRRTAALQLARASHRRRIRRIRGRDRTDHHGLQPTRWGLLTGRHTFDESPADGRFGDSRLASMYKERYWNTQIFDAIAQLTAIAEQSGISLTELALRWLVSKPVAGSLPSEDPVTHLESNIAAIGRGPLDASTVEECDLVGAALRGPMPNYNR
ncbi:aldo/keto reductase [Rhodococcus sp. 3Y1]